MARDRAGLGERVPEVGHLAALLIQPFEVRGSCVVFSGDGGFSLRLIISFMRLSSLNGVPHMCIIPNHSNRFACSLME